MSRSGYCDDSDYDWQFALWRGTVASAIKGRRGQTFLKEMLAAMDAMPVKRLIAHELEAPDLIPCSHWGMFEATSVCAIGALGKARGVDMTALDPDDNETVAGKFNIATPLAQEVVFENDEAGRWNETPEARFTRMRAWVVSHIRDTPPSLSGREK
jgi:hypothetical protein